MDAMICLSAGAPQPCLNFWENGELRKGIENGKCLAGFGVVIFNVCVFQMACFVVVFRRYKVDIKSTLVSIYNKVTFIHISEGIGAKMNNHLFVI